MTISNDDKELDFESEWNDFKVHNKPLSEASIKFIDFLLDEYLENYSIDRTGDE